MAIKLTTKPNTLTPDATYPYGDILDTVGTTPGTPVSREVYADFHQFFERLMAFVGETHNDLPDNATNGFQYMEAIDILRRTRSVEAWIRVNFNPAVGSQAIQKSVVSGSSLDTNSIQRLSPGLYTIEFGLSLDIVNPAGDYTIGDVFILHQALPLNNPGGGDEVVRIYPVDRINSTTFSFHAVNESGGLVDIDETNFVMNIKIGRTSF